MSKVKDCSMFSSRTLENNMENSLLIDFKINSMNAELATFKVASTFVIVAFPIKYEKCNQAVCQKQRIFSIHFVYLGMPLINILSYKGLLTEP
ncbi:hypothetical protein BpHYR1_054118 [Brachionus plicatilis]|uniref:Uncharacterized protein n=1 Tax=Brachionus plicatilis TaxID=10195 RepID=A0A3M7SMA2_BRAPC|nr:hypothetical protein BpHYR1_054118 [Brachionus plicatilis]